MTQVTITGTADQLRRIAQLVEAAADSGTNPKAVSVTLDNGVAGSVLSVTGPDGKKRDG